MDRLKITTKSWQKLGKSNIQFNYKINLGGPDSWPPRFCFCIPGLAHFMLASVPVGPLRAGGSAFRWREERGLRFVPWLFPLPRSWQIHENPWVIALDGHGCTTRTKTPACSHGHHRRAWSNFDLLCRSFPQENHHKCSFFICKHCTAGAVLRVVINMLEGISTLASRTFVSRSLFWHILTHCTNEGGM